MTGEPAGARGPTTHRLRDWSDPPRPLDGFAKTTVVFLISIAVLTFGTLIADIVYINVLGDLSGGFEIGGDFDIGAIDDVDRVEIVLGVLSVFGFIAFCLAAGFFISWMYRAYRNLERTSVAGLRYESGWAIGAWFIPFFNLLRPKQMIDDIWRAGEAGVEVRDDSWRRRPVPILIHWWWGLWVASFIVSFAVGVLSVDPSYGFGDDPDGKRATTAVALVSVLCQLAAAIMAVEIVRRMTRRGDGVRAVVLAAAQEEAAAAQPPPPAAGPPPPAAPLQPTQPGATPPPPVPVPPPPAPPQAPQSPEASQPPAAEGSVSADPEGGYRCDICGWRFSDQDAARTHVESHHGGDPDAQPR